MLNKTIFQIDGGTEYEGYTFGETWNGWECPMFTKETVEKMAMDMSNISSMAFIYDGYYDRYLVVFHENEDVDSPEIYNGTTINYNGEEIKVYPIGSYSWCWDEI